MMTSMLTESLLAYAHFVAILSLVVFLTSEAALCRPEWLNEAVVRRLIRLDRIYMFAAIAVQLTGIARTWWGVKGTGWYWHQPLLHIKVSMYVLIGLISIKPTASFTRWGRRLNQEGVLPSADDVRGVRKWIMVEAHLLVLVPLAATMLARGVWPA
jgi:putative membrane protein